METSITQLTAFELHRRFLTGELSACEIAEAHLASIEAANPTLNAFLHVFAEEVRRTATSQDERRARGEELGPLAAVPIAVKDNIQVLGGPTTCGSKILEGYQSSFDATVIDRLRHADALLLGKTNLDEFAMGSSGEWSAFGPTRNPLDPERVPGGSSSGSVAAVAGNLAPLALGSDTGGSVRQPAGFCGVLGFKPTYGRFSRYGLVAFASSLDQIGLLGRDTADLAMAYDVMAGYDDRDSTSIKEPEAPVNLNFTHYRKPLRIGLVKEFFPPELDPRIRNTILDLIRSRLSPHIILGEVSIPHATSAVEAYYIIAPAEASSNLARYDGVKYGFRASADNLRELYDRTRTQGFGPEVRRRIMLGTFVLSSGYYDAYYGKATRLRMAIRDEFFSVFRTHDLLLGPTSPETAFKLGEKTSDPLSLYMADIFTIPANLAGLPAISIPAGLDETGLPFGMQIMGPPKSDGMVLAFARYLATGSEEA